MFLDPFFTGFRMAFANLRPCTRGVFAAVKQRTVFEAREEDDASVLLDAELLRSRRILLHIEPLCAIDLVYIEGLVIATDVECASAI